jgi:hypothetical protein
MMRAGALSPFSIHRMLCTDAMRVSALRTSAGTGAAPPAAAQVLIGLVHERVGVEAVRVERGCEVDAGADHVRVTRRVARAHGQAAVEVSAAALVAQHRQLRRRPGLAVLRQHPEHRPLSAGIAHETHVPPGQWDTVSSIDRAQPAGRIRVKVVPVTIRRHGGHAPHDERRRELELLVHGRIVAVAYQQPPEWRLRTEQRAREEAAFEVAPREHDVAGIDAERIACARLRPLAHVPAADLARSPAVAAVQNAMADVAREIVLHAARLLLEDAIEVDAVGRLEEGADERLHPALRAARRRRALEPAQLEAVAPAQREQRLIVERKGLAADSFRHALQVGQSVLVRFLIGADQQLRELASRNARLREQLRDCRLQLRRREEHARLERHLLRRARRGHPGVLV